ncbi:MAG TPA: signal peptidase I [Methanophagales archaeon]|nr:signal peptidase I [Methanophagales archaeon]
MKEALIEIGKLLVEVLLIIAIVVSGGYAATGSWHIGFAVESGSMDPNMHVGDLILVQAPHRTNITTYEEGEMLDYESFKKYGDVIIYRPNGVSSKTPIIHRAMYWVDKGEEMPDGKPAPHEGYITKGDNNSGYDQPMLGVEPVKHEWIIAVARVRIPYLGYPSITLNQVIRKVF